MHVEVESSRSVELQGGSGTEGSGFYLNQTGRWWWFDDDEEEDDADDSSWADWIASGVSNAVGTVVLGAAEIGEFLGPSVIGYDVFVNDHKTTTQRPTTTEGSGLSGGPNIFNYG